MSRKQKIYGICRICGENKELTFEHVPPETVFNKGAVRNVTLDAVIKDTVKENRERCGRLGNRSMNRLA